MKLRFPKRPPIPSDEQAIDEELQFHFDELVRGYREQGFSEAEAIEAARLRFGSFAQSARASKNEKGLRFFEWLGHDFQRFQHGLSSRPRLTLLFAVLASLVFGFGAAAVQVRHRWNQSTLNDRRNSTLVWVGEQTAGLSDLSLSLPDARRWNSGCRAFADTGIVRRSGAFVEIAGEQKRLDIAHASAGFFRTFQIAPAAGRLFNESDDATRPVEPTLILGERLFRTAFNGDPGVVGSRIRIDGRAFVVIGIAPETFVFPWRVEAWLCLGSLPESFDDEGYHAGFWGVGRLRPGESWHTAVNDAAALSADFQTRSPFAHSGQSLRLQQFGEHFGGRVSGLLSFLCVALQLVLAFLYIVFLQLLGDEGPHEQAERAAGDFNKANSLRKRRLLAAIIVVVAALVSYVFAELFLSALATRELTQFRALEFNSLTLAVSFVSLVSLPVIVRLIWLVNPANWRTDLTLKDSLLRVKWNGDPLSRYMRVAYVALGFAMIMWAGGLIVSYRQVATSNLGYDGHDVVSVHLDTDERESGLANATAWYEEVMQRLRSRKEIASACISSRVPGETDDYWDSAYKGTEGRDIAAPHLELISIGDSFFRTLNIPLVQGRDFNAADSRESFDVNNPDVAGEWIRGLRVAIIDEAIRQKLWPHGNPLGQKLVLPWGKYQVALEVVGVVKSATLDRRNGGALPRAYVPFRQAPRRGAALIARTALSPEAFLRAVQDEVKQAGVGGTLYGATSLEQTPRNRLDLELFTTALLCALSLFAWLVVGFAASMSARIRGGPLEDAPKIPNGVWPTLEGILLGGALFLVAHSYFGLFFAEVSRTSLVGIFVVSAVLLGGMLNLVSRSSPKTALSHR